MTDKQSKSKVQGGEDGAPVVIKKYANRRLYNTASSSYVTLDYLNQMVRDGTEFVVYDAKTGDDITRSVLGQIIFEQESKGQNLLPISFLRQVIGFYGDTLQSALPRYLEFSMDRFSRDQEKMRAYLVDALKGRTSFNPFEEMTRQNVVMFDRMFQMFSSFSAGNDGVEIDAEPSKSAAPTEGGGDIAELKAQLDMLQSKLDKLAEK
jgi:polyhydroxyalkanoate synthesis repressor PhaR